MLCPNCAQEMKTINTDSQSVLHCSVCGASFFEKGGIEKISKDTAQKLAIDSQGSYILGTKKLCPKDSALLTTVDNPSLPKNTVLLECSQCGGVFVYADDLLKYKRISLASPVSVRLKKLLPPPRSLFMLATFAVLSLTAFLNYRSISNNFATGSKAKDLVSNITTTTDVQKRYLFFYFKTETPVKSKVQFLDKKTYQILVKDVSTEAKSVHQLTTTDLDLTHEITYQIILISGDGSEQKTAEKTLELQ